MDHTQRARASRPSRGSHLSPGAIFFLVFIFAASIIFAGCASPGEPLERRPATPEAVADLSAVQQGNSVLLTFTLPKETVTRHPLDQPPTIEIYRDFAPVPPSSAAKSSAPAVPAQPTLLVTIPSDTVDNFVSQARIRYADGLAPGDFSQHPDSVVTYVVRTRLSPKRDSANSNAAALRVYPAPDPIADLKAEVTHSGIALTWTPPQKSPVGPSPPIVNYQIYRSMNRAAVEATASTGTSAAAASSRAAEPATPLVNIGQAATPNYLDAQAEIGNTYTYSVRSVVRYGTESLESADSNLLAIAARDIFPPAAPQGLVVVEVAARGDTPAHLELSWDISSETDLAGYNLYRSEQDGVLGARLNSDLLPTPTFRDINTVSGRRYVYTVTAVDRSGNESLASSAVSGTVPSESQPSP
jgi:hypothetical protein